jgi:hypothetical protein
MYNITNSHTGVGRADTLSDNVIIIKVLEHILVVVARYMSAQGTKEL